MTHLELNNILSDIQHGFRAKISSETQLITFWGEIVRNANSGGQTDVIFMDFSKAFDVVPHKGWTDHLIGNFTSVWKQDTRIQKFEADGSQRDGEAGLQGRGSVIRGVVGQLSGERRNVHERWTASEWKGGCRFCRGTVRGGCQWLG